MDDLIEGEDVFQDCLGNPDENLNEIRKNLLDDFDTATTAKKMLKDCSKLSGTSSDREPVKVFLRVRPFTDKEKTVGESQGCLEIENMSSVLMHPPKTSFTFKHQARNAVTAETVHRFSFSRVYGPDTSQKDFFEDTSLDIVKDFVDGQNALMFSYGVTNAGKTYTILGNPQNLGILPRTINILFNSFKEKNYHRANLKPKMFCDVQKLSSIQEEREDSKKKMLISLTDVSTYHNNVNSTDLSLQDISNAQCTQEDIIDLSSVDLDATSVDVETQGPIQFSLWISFAEIYNEHIFDLLEPISLGKTRKRNVLKVGDDRNGNPYIKGLTEIHVNNAEEALKLLKIGRKNQKIASTKLNENSSRSHCIFTLKILRVVNKKEPHVARVSRLSFVDLAGSERYTKTQNTGVRLKEAGNINTSIMTLGKCVELLRYNQNHVNNPKNIPFRESKLTRLLQGFFCGKGKASMVVNVNQCASAFDETLHALKFSAIAKKVTTQIQAPVSIQEPEVEKSVRMSVAWADGSLSTPAGNKLATELSGNEMMAPLAEQEESMVSGPSNQELHALIVVLKQQLIEEKKKMSSMEIKIRQEVCQEMAEQMVEIENNYNERLLEDQRMNEDLYEKRMDIVTKSVKRTRKRPRVERVEDDDDEWVSSVLLHKEKIKVEEMKERFVGLEQELKEKTESLTSKVEQLHKQLTDRDQQIQSLKETSILEKQLKEKTQNLSSEIEVLRKELASRDQEIQSLKETSILEQKLKEKTQNFSSEIEMLRKELAGRDQEIQSLKETSKVEQQLKENTQCLSSEVEQLREKLTTRDKELRSLEEKFDLEGEVKEKTKTLSSEVERLCKELTDRDEKIKLFNETSSYVDQLKEKSKDLSLEVEKLRKELTIQRSGMEAQLIKEKTSLSEVEKLHNELACRDKENELLKVSMKDCKIELESKTTELMAVKKVGGGRAVTPRKTGAVNNNLVKHLEKRLQETTTALDKKNTQLISKNNCIAKLEETLKCTQENTKDQEKELLELRGVRELLAEEKKKNDDKRELLEAKVGDTKLEELENVLAAKSKENEEVLGNLKFVEGELEILSNNDKEKGKELTKLKEDCEKLQKEVHEWKEQVENLKELKNNVVNELKDKENAFKQTKAELEDMGNCNESKERELQRREIKIKILTEEIEGLKKELTHVHDNYKCLQETNDQALSDLVNVQATVNVRNQELEQFENLDMSQKQAYREMQTEVMNAKRDFENTKNDLQLREKEMDQIKKEMEIRMKEEVLKVKGECQNATERMKIGLAEQDEVLSQMEKEMIVKENELTESQEKIEKLNNIVQDRDENVKKLTEENATLEDQVERLKIRVFEIETEVERLQQDLKIEKSKKENLKALKEGLEIVKSKKAEYEDKKNMMVKENEEQKKNYEQKIKNLENQLRLQSKSDESDEKTTSEKDSSSAPSDDDNSVYKPVEVESFNLSVKDRLEIDVTPITGSGLGKSGKKKGLKSASLKRQSSELTLKEIKDLHEEKHRIDQSEDDFTPVSVKKLRKTRSSSVNVRSYNSKASIVASPSTLSLPVFDENAENTCPLSSQNSQKSLVSGKRRLLNKLGIHESAKHKSEKLPCTKTVPKKRRKLLKKNEISAPLSDSPHSQCDKLEKPNPSSRAQDIITRHLRSRVVKSAK